MNKEELEKEAIKCMHEIKYWIRVPIKKETEKDGISEILKLTEPREKRIEELEAQIEKMKCCENCKHSNTNCECYTICTIGHYDDCKSNTVLDSLDKRDYWEN